MHVSGNFEGTLEVMDAGNFLIEKGGTVVTHFLKEWYF